ncbi:MAG: phosphatidylglycerol lysyltransferase domain-containing protein [bacterium]
MIPQFPEFKKLELSDKDEIENFTHQFPPYSDFNFVSMWTWDVRGDMAVSYLNNNLIVRFSHYLTEDSFYSLIGKNELTKTVEALKDYVCSLDTSCKELKLIPEIVANLIDPEKFEKIEEPDQFDYIYDLKVLSSFSGGHFASKRTAMNKLMRTCPTLRAEILDINDEKTKFNIKKINIAWMRYKAEKDPYDEVRNELIAIDRFLAVPEHRNIVTVGVFIDDQIVGYHLAEIVDDVNAICHYVKADFSHNGIYDYMMKETARILIEHGCQYLNFEQDLGLEGLKKSKERFSTGIFLKKYKIVLE